MVLTITNQMAFLKAMNRRGFYQTFFGSTKFVCKKVDCLYHWSLISDEKGILGAGYCKTLSEVLEILKRE